MGNMSNYISLSDSVTNTLNQKYSSAEMLAYCVTIIFASVGELNAVK